MAQVTYRGVAYDTEEYNNKVLEEATKRQRHELMYRGVKVQRKMIGAQYNGRNTTDCRDHILGLRCLPRYHLQRSSITRTEVVTMLRIKVDWARPILPEFDPVKHDPERTFAFLTYRGVNYAKWVYLKVHFNAIKDWKITS